jgi:hypothetical protein
LLGERADLGKAGTQIPPSSKSTLLDELDRGFGSLPLANVGNTSEIDQVLLIPRPASGVARDKLHRNQVADLGDLRDHTGHDLDRLCGPGYLRLDARGGEQQVHDRTSAIAPQSNRRQAFVGRLLQGGHDLIAILAQTRHVACRLVVVGHGDSEVEVTREPRLGSYGHRNATDDRAGDVGRTHGQELLQ